MSRRLVLLVVLALTLAASPTVASAEPTAGAPGIGDPYFPLDGNGGYDVGKYTLDVDYDPATDVLKGVTTMTARATQDLSSFNLDFDDAMTVRSITVGHRPATFTRDEDELTVTPRKPIKKGDTFRVVTRYDGIPETIGDSVIGLSGFIHTDDGALAVGQPDSAATWFPANDHPRDKARLTVRATVPEGLEAISNGLLKGTKTTNGKTTWTWNARRGMAPYLVTLAIGQFDINEYKKDGISFLDAIDPQLTAPITPRTGEQFLISQAAQTTYKRLGRTISVPEEGGQLSFWVRRDTEPTWDYFFVEAHPVGTDDWTTLPDVNGHTSQETGAVCPYWLGLHPFLGHYQSENPDGSCSPTGTTGDWHAVSGGSEGFEQWTVDLTPYAGQDVEIALSYASDDLVQYSGVQIDDIEGPGGEGSTSFEDDGDTLDGWTVLGAPEGSIPNENDWIVGTAADAPPPIGKQALDSLAREPEVINFLEGFFGRYPFSASGGIVDKAPITFALETQTRPVYAPGFFTDKESGDSVVVHELAHQWTGDYLRLENWQDIWLNEGFATYTEWLWGEYEGIATVQEYFDFYTQAVWPDADDPFWSVVIGDPGPDLLFDSAVYYRGAMTLQALRVKIGDEQFFRLVKRWIRSQAAGTATTDEFIALAEEVSGQQLDDFFDEWLFTGERPASLPAAAPSELSASKALNGLASPMGRSLKR